VALISCPITAAADGDNHAASMRARGLGDRRKWLVVFCRRQGWRSCDNSVPCCGRHDEQTSLAQQVERALRMEQRIHYAILAFSGVAIHNLARLAHQLFIDEN
jgi:hypothetical protein